MRLRIVSLNVWEGGLLLPQVLDYLSSVQADVVALQEVYNGSDPAYPPRSRTFTELAKLGYEHSDFQTMFTMQREEGDVPLGNAILSRFPILNAGKHYFLADSRLSWAHLPENFSLFPRMMQTCQLQTPAGLVKIVNCHGVWDLDGDSASEQRYKMIESIVNEIEPDMPTILLGDTNAKMSNPIWKDLILRPVLDSDVTTTFNMRRKDNPGYATAAVDLMFVSDDIQIVSTSVPDVDISDHLPIVAELVIPQK